MTTLFPVMRLLAALHCLVAGHPDWEVVEAAPKLDVLRCTRCRMRSAPVVVNRARWR